MSANITRLQTPEERELEKKRADLEMLEANLAQCELELTTFQAELHAFEGRYLRNVGVRYAVFTDSQPLDISARLLCQACF